jgi:hypothetical protein
VVGGTDSLDFSGVNANAVGEGLILPQTTTCTGTTDTGAVCYGTTSDELCVYDGAAYDCVPVSAHTTDTSADTECSGSSTYYDGDGNCDTSILSDVIKGGGTNRVAYFDGSSNLEDESTFTYNELSDTMGVEKVQFTEGANNWAFDVDTSGNLTVTPTGPGWASINHSLPDDASGYFAICNTSGVQLELCHTEDTYLGTIGVDGTGLMTLQTSGGITLQGATGNSFALGTDTWDAQTVVTVKSGVGDSTMFDFQDSAADTIFDITQDASGSPPTDRLMTLYDSDLTLNNSANGAILTIEQGDGAYRVDMAQFYSLGTQNHIWMARGTGNIAEDSASDSAAWQIAGSRNSLALIGQRPDVTITCNTGDYTIANCERMFDAGDYATIADIDDNSPNPATATAIVVITDTSGLDQMHPWMDGLLDGKPAYNGVDNFYWGAIYKGNGKVLPADVTIEAQFDNNEDGDGCGGSCQWFTVGQTLNNDNVAHAERNLNFSNPSACMLTGDHDGADHATIMTDTDAAYSWDTNEWVGYTIQNVTEGDSGVVTSNTSNTITVASLSGPGDNKWQDNDVYQLTSPTIQGKYRCIRDPYKIYGIKITLSDWRYTEVCAGDSTCDDAFITEMFLGQYKEWLYPYYLPRYDPHDRWPMVDELNWVDTDGTFYGIDFDRTNDEFDVDAPISVSGVAVPTFTDSGCIHAHTEDSWTPIVYDGTSLDCMRPTDDGFGVAGNIVFVDETGTYAGDALHTDNRISVGSGGDTIEVADTGATQYVSLGPCDGTDCKVLMSGGAGMDLILENPTGAAGITACGDGGCGVGDRNIDLQAGSGSDGKINAFGELVVTGTADFTAADGLGIEVDITGDLNVGGSFTCGGGTGCSTPSSATGANTLWTINAEEPGHTGSYLEIQDEASTIFEVDPNGNLTTLNDIWITGSNKELRFYEGVNYVGFEAPALSADQVWVLPTADGSANQYLQTNGSGILSWAATIFTDIDTDYGAETVTSAWKFIPNGTGAFGAYDLEIGDTTTPDYGALRIGASGIYASSFSTGNIDLDKTLVFRQEGSVGGILEFAWIEGGNTLRAGIPESSAGNASNWIRSFMIAGPYSAATGDNHFICDTHTAYNGNIDCDTGTTGADMFIQDDLEVEGTIFAHETINLEGATADGNQVIVQVGADPGADVTISLPTATGTLATLDGALTGTAAAIDADQDTVDEVSISDSAVLLDGDDDGIALASERVITDSITMTYNCEGDNLTAVDHYFHASGSNLLAGSNYGGRQVCRNYTGASDGDDSIMGFGLNAATTGANLDFDRFNQFGASIAVLETSAYCGAVGFLSSSTSQDIMTLDLGCYFYCCPDVDIDGDGTTGDGGDTDDDKWWFVCQDGDTDNSGELCATQSGSPSQCDTYQATNTEAWNTGVDCENIYEFHRLQMEINQAASSVAAYVDGTLEATFTTELPSSYIYAPVVWWEAQEAVNKRVFVDWIEVNHDR